MKLHLHTLFTHALAQVQAMGVIPKEITCEIQLERTRDNRHGDFACNVAMLLAKKVGMRPRDLANLIIQQLPDADEFIAKVEVAGPGFINVFITTRAYYNVIGNILFEREAYGQSSMGVGKSIIVEFVSANPTGPLHVGHGRGAAYGAALANLLKVAGYRVHCEYYVNDAGRQMDILATSVWLRYLELCGETVKFPVNGYKGSYIWEMATNLHREHESALYHPIEVVFEKIPPDVDEGGDQELHIDALIERTKQLLGDLSYRHHVFQPVLRIILGDIRGDLAEFGVVYDTWFSEASLTAANNMVQKAIAQLKAYGHLYEQDGAWWFRSSAFGDEKDRVVVRENGQVTYFASDIAYHLNKIERGFDVMINIWGADHHGYIARLKAAIAALGADPDRLTVLLVQFATLYRGKERLQMSTRSGEFVTLRELRNEVGRDAARFFYVQRRSEQHLNFDLDLARSQSLDNPVYYIQYAYARTASVFRRLSENGQIWTFHLTSMHRLDTAQEQDLIVTLARYPEVIESAAQAYEPHQLTYYLRELAQQFHVCYDAHKILVDDDELRNARLSLLAATQQILRNGLGIIGVSALEMM